MPNVDRPSGLRPVKNLKGSPFTGKVTEYLVPAADGTALFIGDLVKLSGSAGAAGLVVSGRDVEGMPTVIQSAAGDLHVGVVVGFLPASGTDLSVRHRVASTNRIALVVDDPDVVFEIQEVSGGTAFTVSEVGLNANVVVSAGSATTGMSGMEMNNSGENTTADLDLKILGLAKRPDNAIGEHAKWLVQINTHSYGNSAGNTGL